MELDKTDKLALAAERRIKMPITIYAIDIKCECGGTFDPTEEQDIWECYNPERKDLGCGRVLEISIKDKG